MAQGAIDIPFFSFHINRAEERICFKKKEERKNQKKKKYITSLFGCTIRSRIFAFAFVPPLPGNRLCEHAIRAGASSEVLEWCGGENGLWGRGGGVGVCTKRF